VRLSPFHHRLVPLALLPREREIDLAQRDETDLGGLHDADGPFGGVDQEVAPALLGQRVVLALVLRQQARRGGFGPVEDGGHQPVT